MITSLIHVNIARENRENDRRAVMSLYSLTDSPGTKVTIYVGSREVADPETCRHMAEYAMDLHLEVTGDPVAVEQWCRMIRGYA